MQRLPPLPIAWTMKPLASARWWQRDLADGRLEVRIDHEELLGVTPAMLEWWFQHLPNLDDVEIGGVRAHAYRFWHPIDHVGVCVRRPAPTGPGFRAGARVEICEILGDRAMRMHARVDAMDQSGITLHLRGGGATVARLRHDFAATAAGARYATRLIVGPTVPVLGRLGTAFLRRAVLTPTRIEAWVRHNVEEVGNFQFFLPQLFEATA